MDSDIFDVVPRAEDTTTGAWRNTGTAQLSTHIASVPLPASPNERVRVDIARFDPGDHGGGRFFLTAVPRGKGDPPAPDLLVRAHTTKFRPEAVGKNGCEPTATIAVYVTNQGDADAINVSVRITGELATLVNQSQVATRQFDQNVMIGNFALGETRAWTIRVQAPARAYSFSIEGRINVDPSNTVSESVETNNDATVAPTDFACGRKIVSADTELMRLSENPGTLLDLENAISGRSAAFSANLRPVLDWIRDKGPRPETSGDPHRERLIERLAPMQDAGLFRHDVATFFASKKSWAKELRGSRLEAARKLRQRADTWLAARKKADRPAMKSYPGTLLATPAGLFVRDGTRLIPGDPSKPWALLDFGGNVPLSDIFLNGNQLDFDTQDGPLPVLPGRHRVRISNQENGRSHVWDIDLPSGKKRVLTIPVKIRKK